MAGWTVVPAIMGGVGLWSGLPVDVALKGALLLGGAWVVATALRRGSAASRHQVWKLAVWGLLVLPAASLVLPRWRVSVPVPAGVAVSPPVAAESRVPFAHAGDGAITAVRDDGREPVGPQLVGRGVVWSTAVPAERSASAALPGERVGTPSPVAADGGDPGIGAAERPGVAGPGERGAPVWRARSSGPPWSSAMVLVWLAGMTVLLGLTGVQTLAVRWLARRARPVPAGGVIASAARGCAARLGLRRVPALVEGDERAMPMTWGILRPVVLLPAGADRWPPARLDAVLKHEFAHVRRRDCLTQLVAELARAVHWFNPLAWVAVRRLQREREHACDDEVLAAGARPSAYAAELLELARGLRAARATALAALSMARPSQLSERLAAVLDGRRRRSRLDRGAALPAWFAAGALVLPLAAASPEARTAPAANGQDGSVLIVTDAATADEAGAAVAAGPAAAPTRTAQSPRVAEVEPATGPAGARSAPARPPAGYVPQGATWDCHSNVGRGRRVSHNTSNGTSKVEWSNGRCAVEVRVEGELRFTDDFTGVAGLSSGGFLRIEERMGRQSRRLEMRPGTGGTPEIAWFVDGGRREFDGTARAWLDEMLIHLFRTAGFAAAERVDWMLARQGPDAVLAEVQQIPSDHVQRRYLEHLIERSAGDAAVLERAVALAGREIGSDHELGRVLRAGLAQPLDARALAVFLDATRSIGSDHEKGRVLRAVLGRGPLGGGDVAAMLETASDIDSDHELGRILRALSQQDLTGPASQRAFLKAAGTIASDHELRRVLSSLIGATDLSPEIVLLVLESARSIGSDHELARLLIEVLDRHPIEGPVRAAFLEALETIGSRHEHGRVSSALLRKGVVL